MVSFLQSLPLRIRLSLGLSLFVLVAVAVGLLADRLAERHVPSVLPGLGSVSFTLDSVEGTVSNTDLLGQPVALFFGFTHCPEICPTTLYTLDNLLAEVGASDSVRIVFITVDPTRDTPEVLADYIANISSSALGLSGDAVSIRQVVRDFGIYAQQVALEGGGYTLDHTATVFLYGEDGRLASTIAWGEPAEFAREKLRRLVGG